MGFIHEDQLQNFPHNKLKCMTKLKMSPPEEAPVSTATIIPIVIPHKNTIRNTSDPDPMRPTGIGSWFRRAGVIARAVFSL